MVETKPPLPFRCVVIDDEPPAIAIVSNYIKRIREVELIASFNNAMDAKKFIETNKPEIIISDIKMPGKSGIDLVKGLGYQPSVIFASAYDQYAIHGYELGVIDFLRKPFSFQRFNDAIRRITRPKAPLLQELQKNDPFIFLKADRIIHRVMLSQVFYFQAFGNYCKAYFTDGSVRIYNSKISTVEELVKQHGFLRVHKSYAIATAHVQSISNQTIVINRTPLPIGESYKKTVGSYFKSYSDGTL
ncbi:MAG: LytR/AlgR family response regulator transcription factor [Chryseotalea sp.]